jgi:RNA-directed DNA polymerase
LNTRIKGWARYHRHACSKRTFNCVDSRIFGLLWRWRRRRHRGKSRTWIKEKYFKRLGGRNRVFTGSVRDGQGKTHPICLMSAARVRIVRQVQVRGEANPYEPEWEAYFEGRLLREMRGTLAGQGRIYWLWKEQQGRCPVCGQPLQEEEEWHLHHRVRRSQGGSDGLDNLELLHANCHRQRHSQGVGTEAGCVSQEAFVKA